MVALELKVDPKLERKAGMIKKTANDSEQNDLKITWTLHQY